MFLWWLFLVAACLLCYVLLESNCGCRKMDLIVAVVLLEDGSLVRKQEFKTQIDV
jgi:hypothetical protein